MRNIGMVAMLLVLLACAAPAQQPAASPGASGAAAQVGDRTISMQEVEARWRADDPAGHTQALQSLYDGRRAALDAIIAEMLIEQAAEPAGVSPAQYEQAEMAKRTKPVTDAEILSFFQSNQSQMQGRGLAEMTPAIRNYLEQQQQDSARRALIAELRMAGPPVSVLFDAPRQEVAVTGDDPVAGNANAPVTIVEFSDFQCPFCQRVMPTLKRLRETYGDKVRLVWKDFPLTQIHPEAFKAAEAGNCAREQGKFWEYHDRLFANQQLLQPDALKQHAAEVGLETTQFNECLDTAKYSTRVQEQMEAGAGLGVTATPAVFINGRLISGAHPYDTFAAVVDEELEQAAR